MTQRAIKKRTIEGKLQVIGQDAPEARTSSRPPLVVMMPSGRATSSNPASHYGTSPRASSHTKKINLKSNGKTNEKSSVIVQNGSVPKQSKQKSGAPVIYATPVVPHPQTSLPRGRSNHRAGVTDPGFYAVSDIKQLEGSVSLRIHRRSQSTPGDHNAVYTGSHTSSRAAKYIVADNTDGELSSAEGKSVSTARSHSLARAKSAGERSAVLSSLDKRAADISVTALENTDYIMHSPYVTLPRNNKYHLHSSSSIDSPWLMDYHGGPSQRGGTELVVYRPMTDPMGRYLDPRGFQSQGHKSALLMSKAKYSSSSVNAKITKDMEKKLKKQEKKERKKEEKLRKKERKSASLNDKTIPKSWGFINRPIEKVYARPKLHLVPINYQDGPRRQARPVKGYMDDTNSRLKSLYASAPDLQRIEQIYGTGNAR